MDRTKIDIVVPADLKERLQAIAELQADNLSSLGRRAILEYVRKTEKQLGIPHPDRERSLSRNRS